MIDVYEKMKRVRLLSAIFFFVLAIALFIALFNSIAPAQTFQGNVVQWYDADSVRFRLLNGRYYKVRLQGIDAPERRQTMGLECRSLLMSATEKKTISIMFYGADSYKRMLGVLITPTISNVNLWLIQQGCAWEYSAPLEVKTLYQTTEATARSNLVGLWQDPCPTEPWAFRSSGYKICP